MKCRVLLSILLLDAITGMAQSPFPFVPTGSMITPRASHTATLLLNGKVLIAGGGYANDSKSVSASAELYDPATGTFTPTGGMTSPRACSAILLADGRVLVVGCAMPSNSAEVYDPTTGTFATIGTSPYPFVSSLYVSTMLADSRVLITGGCGPQVFDPEAGTFTITGYSSRQCLDYSPYFYTTTLLPDGKVCS